jgi:hypothetical protein
MWTHENRVRTSLNRCGNASESEREPRSVLQQSARDVRIQESRNSYDFFLI